ncbi:MAG: 50S ribosomal protein L17 [Candidatus Staskawiczbacteria bacterium RIFOXYC1_FULL_37_43]|nr:MAG: 50S ribosomal protein L17 [Candidatus Staskawiczbacteria bacterium RIFCSPHIGHO2_01_FULL_37_17]OGZ72346.1 MAG: 50S ribosomal protein L17 [Candidatus Staskawiczbacteria bacterium RIFCSPLOWO2_01_FULL_37_19]OGZ76110.1 MAG: 50S ribosomal protein L17 [Candidatus Staskawiczbacteria bacterium RIFOXYA1_FULL_37_15]OGZ76468.1 MAG: 50S ribosomal protein L17 [Candidatus Staskawiczbacteria bacterium RIFOXYA12_FULL_37_10]OGZ80077.1 MAG: 50S ribosomal protein L17 [Candidatus Staskawiczbacteria bacteriu
MRKLNKGRKLSRKKGPRKALLRSLANNFFLHERIKTTEAKAKELRPIVEKLITRAKKDTVANRRQILRTLIPEMAKKIFVETAPKYQDRNGGYTRILRLSPRNSDGAKMAIIELVKQ